MTDSENALACLAVNERREAKPDHTLRPQGSQIHVAWLIVPCLAADGLMVPGISLLQVGPGVIVAAIALGIVGCVLAQGCLLAAWLAWGDEPFLRRLLTHWKIAGGLFALWLAGLVLAVPSNDEAQLVAATVALGVPLVSLAAQFPLWLARHLFGWRLVQSTANPSSPREQRLTIRDLMVATLVVAAALALVRLSPVFYENPRALWPAWGIAVTVASLISSISLLPAGVLLLRSQQLDRGLKWSALYAGAWIALPWIIVAIVRFYGLATVPPWQAFVCLSSLMLTFAATLTLTATIARDRGYRLASRKNSSP